MARVVHFEVHSSDPDRSRAFYETVLGWEANQWGDQPYWVLYTGEEGEPGIDGGMMPRHGPAPTEGQPLNAFVCTVQVEDVHGTVEKAREAGGSVALEAQDMPGIGTVAYIKDPDGNILGLLQPVAETAQA